MIYAETGLWNDEFCSRGLNYVCKSPTSSTPFEPVTTTTEAPETAACGHNFVEDLTTGICYRLETQRLTFTDARVECESFEYIAGQTRPTLVSLNTRLEQIFVQGV